MSPDVSCGGELEKVIAPKGTIQAAHDTESLHHVSAQLPITQRIEIKAVGVSPLTLPAWSVRWLFRQCEVQPTDTEDGTSLSELERYRADIAVHSETRLSEHCHLEELGAGYTFYRSGRPRAK
nr:unnamed protein product [Spirometra erinaceieuropaei]